MEISFLKDIVNPECGLDRTLTALKQLRVNVVDDEYELQNKISAQLQEAGIGFKKEFYLGPRNRVDFMVDGGIAIEVKKGKPNKQQVVNQIIRYTRFEEVKAVVLIVETSLEIPGEINGKECISFGLNKLWGIAL